MMNSELLSDEQTHEEYVMLALRSSGIDLNEYKKKFGESWINKNYTYLKELSITGNILIDDKNIKLTPKGYAVCDEILKNIL